MVQNSTLKINPKLKTTKELSQKVKYLGDVQDFILEKMNMLEMKVKETKEEVDKLKKMSI